MADEKQMESQAQVSDPDGKIAAAEAERKARKGMLKSIPSMMLESAAERKLNEVVSHALPDEVNRMRRMGFWKSMPIIGTVIDWMDKTHWLRQMLGMNKEK